MRDRFKINEIFYSLQGEGVRAGIPSVFVRFSACNLQCKLATHGFDCDTDFVSGEFYTGRELLKAVLDAGAGCRNVIFTGGEPALQLDQGLVDLFKFHGCFLSIETNGTKALPKSLDWIVCSPKPPDDKLEVTKCHELKCVVSVGMMPSDSGMEYVEHRIVSPAHQLDGTLRKEDLDWCIKLVKAAPDWRLSVQQHKTWGVR